MAEELKHYIIYQLFNSAPADLREN